MGTNETLQATTDEHPLSLLRDRAAVKVKQTVYWNRGNPDIHSGTRRQVSGSALF